MGGIAGQAEVVNWLRTTPEKIATMRYAGEWKLAGGNVDEGETIAAAAARELQAGALPPVKMCPSAPVLPTSLMPACAPVPFATRADIYAAPTLSAGACTFTQNAKPETRICPYALLAMADTKRRSF